MDVQGIRRALALCLAPYRVVPEVDSLPGVADFPRQVRWARGRADARKAIAAVWFRVVPIPGGQSELYIHLLDRISRKTVVRTMKLVGRLGPDLHRSVALKIWSLLRAALLELGEALRKTPRLARLAGLPAGRAGSGSPGHGPAHAAGPRRVSQARVSALRLDLGVGYVFGFYGAGELLHHGGGASLELQLLRWLGAQFSVAVYHPTEVAVSGSTLELAHTAVELGVRAGWRFRRVAIHGSVGGAVFVITGRAQRLGFEPWRATRVNPALSLGVRLAWIPISQLSVFVHAGLDVLGRYQQYLVGDELVAGLHWAHLTFGIGLTVLLHRRR
ncbi:MAG: hypothetical protein ABI333_14210 [bacterium]